MTSIAHSGGAPAWQLDLNHQVAVRNSLESGPSRSLFVSYAALRSRATQLQNAEEERQRLHKENGTLHERVRQLEAAVADVSVRSSREVDLERKKDELQERLQEYLVRDSEYYKGLADVREWKDRVQVAEGRAMVLEGEVARQSGELQLIRKEYLALRDGVDVMQVKATQSDRYALQVKDSQAKMMQLHENIHVLEEEVNRLRRAANENAVHVDPQAPLSFEGTAAAAAEDAHSAAMSRPDEQTYPKKVAHVIEDAHSGAILQAVCVTENNRHVYTSGSDKLIRQWDPNTGNGTRHFSSGTLALSLGSVAHYLIAGCVDRVTRLWDTNTLRVLELAGHTDKVVSACLSTTAQHAFTASADSTIRLWDVRRRDALRTLMCTSTSNDLTVAAGNIFSAHCNGTIVVWDRRTATRTCEERAHQRSATCVRVSADGRLCVSIGKDNAISVRDSRIMSRPLRHITSPEITVSTSLARLTLSPDSKLCALGNTRGQVLLVALEEETEKALGKSTIVATLSDGGHVQETPVCGVAWGYGPHAPLVSLGEDHRLVLWR